jgi:methylenetetrahydrofolate--tRNA-(uracil-5-)-methyltransferase
VTRALEAHPLVTIERGEVAGLPPEEWSSVIVATGPLTSPALAQAVLTLTGEKELAFFDAIAPIVYRESINMDVAWFQSRYDKVGARRHGKDYINCPMTREQYDAFVDALIAGDKTEFKEWEGTPYFDGCLPIEVMAERGRETLRHGPMKPVGLTDPRNPTVKPYAIVQLRQDNALGTLFNMVGFQTKLKYGAQSAIFRMIPGLENAEFARLGGIHRNTYLNSPNLLDPVLRLKAMPRLRFAGPDHGLRGLCGERCGGPHGGPFRCGRAAGAADPAPAPHDGARRAHQSHHRRAHRDHRRGSALLPAHEREFRPLSPAGAGAEGRGRQASARLRQGDRAEEGAHRAGAR